VDRKKSRSLLVTAQLTDFVNLLAILKCVAMTKKELEKKKKTIKSPGLEKNRASVQKKMQNSVLCRV
jgi:hypothetical protein